MKEYINLHSHTTFSILDGLFSPQKYLEKAKELGMKAYAITDHGTLAGVFEFYDAAIKLQIKPIIGIEAYFVDNKNIKDKNIKYSHIILLAKNKEGYEALLKAQYDACKNGFYYKPRIDWKNLEEMSGNIIATSACASGIIAKNIDRVERLKDIFGDDFYIEFVALERISVYGELWSKLYEVAKKFKIKCIITCDSHYLNRDDAELQDIIHNISEKTTMDDIKNGKGWVFQDRDLYLKSYDEVENIMKKIFNINFVEECLNNTLEVENKIEKFNIYPESYVLPKIKFDEEKFKKILKEALYKKCPKNNIEKYKKRLIYEYKIIKKMGFLEYFFIVQDIVNWAKSQGIEVGFGRGSAGGSLIVYLLGITNCDPLKFNLPFYRFINFTRVKMPDIDIDFQKLRRQEVLNYIKKYGEDNVLPIGNYVKLSFKSALKDVLKIYNIPFKEANEISKLYDTNKEEVLKKYEKYCNIANRLVGNIRHFSKHAAGVIITDKPLYKYIPLNRLHNELITGIDGNTLQKRFLKIDILGLDALDIINLTLKYIKQYEGKEVDLLNIDLKDQNVYELFRKVDTDNIFQFETFAFKELLKEVQPSEFKHLVEINALNRPVPKSMNYHIRYIERRFGASYKIPKLLEKHLSDTYGLLLYQEQVIKILADLLDINFGEADNIRREIEDIGLKNALKKYENKLYKKYNKEDVITIIKELENIAGYAFNKIHSTQYAMISYQMAYLKTYFRKYFNVAVLNIENDDNKIQKTLDDCYKNNIIIKDFNLNEISYEFKINDAKEIIPGCRILKGIGEKTIKDIINKKPFKNINDFFIKCNPRINILEILYEYNFFKNCFGNVENIKVKKFLINKKGVKK